MTDSVVDLIQEAIKEAERLTSTKWVVYGSAQVISHIVPKEYMRSDNLFYYLGIKWCIVLEKYLKHNCLYVTEDKILMKAIEENFNATTNKPSY